MDNQNDLPPLSAEQAELVAAYPLPEGTPDAIVNKAQLAMGLDTTETTISAWLRKGLPSQEAGTNGRSYQFRLSLAFAWVSRMRAQDHSNRAAADRAVQQLQMALLGGESAQAQNGKLSLADQRKLIELELQRTNAARQRGELIRRDDIITAFEDVFSAIRDALDALPDRLARELGAQGRDLEKIEAACDDALAQAARLAGEILDDQPTGGAF